MLKRIVLCLIFFVCSIQAQSLFTENFNLFFQDDQSATTKGFWVFDTSFHDVKGGLLISDTSGNGNDLSLNGWSDEADLRNSATTVSPIFNNSGVIDPNGTDEFFSISSASAGDFNPGTNNFSISVMIKDFSSLNNERVIAKRAGTAGYELYANATQVTLFVGDGVAFVTAAVNHNITGTGWHTLTANIDRGTPDSVFFYIDGNLVGGKSISTVSNAISPAANLYVLAKFDGTAPFPNPIAQIKFKTALSTEKEIKEFGNIADGWKATAGNVVRTDFFQSAFGDTLLVPLPNSTLGNNQEWVLTLMNIDTLTAWVGSRSIKKSTVKTITGGLAFTANTTYFGDGFSLVGDSLVVVFPADTASIDNIVFKKATHHLSGSKKGRWLGW